MKFSDQTCNGYLSIYKEFPDGTRETVLEDDPNTITMASRRHHLAFLHDETTSIDKLASFKVGSGGTIDPDGLRPLVPDPTRNDLYNSITLFNKDIVLTPSDPTDNSQVYLQITFTLAQDEANGVKVSECGVFKESGQMFNIKTFAAIEKSESFSLIFDWKIRYV